MTFGRAPAMRIVASGGAEYGGAMAVLALKVLDHFHMHAPIYESGESLALLARLDAAMQAEKDWLTSLAFLLNDDEATKTARLDEAVTRIIAAMETPASVRSPVRVPVTGSPHSSQVIVVDRDHNVVTGSNTINSLPWGEEARFVGGVVLNSSAHYLGMTDALLTNLPIPGARRPDYLTNLMIMGDDGEPLAAIGSVGTGLLQAAYQVAWNKLAFAVSAQDALLVPRLGGPDFSRPGEYYLSPGVPQSVLAEATARGARFSDPERALFTLQDAGYVMYLERDNAGWTGVADPNMPDAAARAY